MSHLGEAYSQLEVRESPYTIPNALTLARLAACPFLGYCIIQGDFKLATGLLFASGLSDWVRF
jgi:cardiolipin synthase